MKSRILVLSVLPFLLLPASSLASAPSEDGHDVAPEEIIRRFAEKESEFSEVWRQYTYTQRILFQVLDRFDQVKEQREMVIEVYFTNDGRRHTRTLSDRGGLVSVGVTREDISDAVSRQPFVLTTEELPKYRIKYKGKERVDELDTYVFDVEPRRKVKGERYFDGRIWVDDLDLQIVMSRGKIVPDDDRNKFPKFEAVREQIDGKYWFPTWIEADDVLHFGSIFEGRRSVHIRQLITFDNFQKFEVDTSIQYEPVP